MRWVTLTAVIIAVLTVAAWAPTADAQGIFSNLLNNIDSRENYEGAPYQVIKSTGGYEERFYPAKKWACTEGQGRSGDDIGDGMFMNLFRYIQGANAQQESIAMTIPVSTQVSRDANSGIITHRMCFYIGEIHQANPPQPTNSQVFIENRQPITIFTRQVGGYMNDNTWREEARSLNTILNRAGESFSTQPYWRVGYDSPMKFWDRRNEIWFNKN